MGQLTENTDSWETRLEEPQLLVGVTHWTGEEEIPVMSKRDAWKWMENKDQESTFQNSPGTVILLLNKNSWSASEGL